MQMQSYRPGAKPNLFAILLIFFTEWSSFKHFGTTGVFDLIGVLARIIVRFKAEFDIGLFTARRSSAASTSTPSFTSPTVTISDVEGPFELVAKAV